ncbi:Wadjet anti-phage system protein JetD domain-containing protein [Acinetobacter sp. AS167]|uniref:Wadjet anti-phage system protein JetD domain-containing protein n=1 Tax=Acinetobacter sp. AS167 TaxID=3127884 RepID=UPI00301ADD3B
MITAQEIKLKAQRRYAEYLKSLINESTIFPLVIPGNKTYNKSSMDEFRREISDISKDSKEKKGFGYTIEYQTIRTKSLGLQDLPIRVFFECEEDFILYIAKLEEVKAFKLNYKKILQLMPKLKTWIELNPLKVIDNATNWDSLLKVCQYFQTTPQPNLYIRELPILVHTKFIEQNKGVLRALLLEIIPEYCDPKQTNFENCFNLKAHESQVRFRILDSQLSSQYLLGITDLAIPLSQFKSLTLPIKRVIVIENKTSFYTALTLPDMSNTIVIFGSGYKIAELKQVTWFNDVELLYWGDIDSQGFEILSQFRSYFPHTNSLLMDEITFNLFFEQDSGTPTTINMENYLNDEEQYLYQRIRSNNWRLEQEKIPVEYVNKSLHEFYGLAIAKQ